MHYSKMTRWKENSALWFYACVFLNILRTELFEAPCYKKKKALLPFGFLVFHLSPVSKQSEFLSLAFYI